MLQAIDRTDVFTTLEAARKSGQIALLVGPTGIGKSDILRQCASAVNETAPGGQSPILLHIADVVSTPRGLAAGLLAQLDVLWRGTARSGLAVLKSRMRTAHVSAIVVDEAHRLAANSLEFLRELHEATGVSVILAGPLRLRGQLLAKAPELAHHVTHIHAISAWVSPTDILPFIKTGSDNRKRRSYWERVAIARRVARMAGGNMRRALQILSAARREASRRHRALSAHLLDETTCQFLDAV